MLKIVKTVPIIAIFSGLVLPLIVAIVLFVACAHNSSGPYIWGALKIALLALPFVAAWKWGVAGFQSPFTARRTQIICEGIVAGAVMSVVLLWIMLVPGLAVMKAAAPQVVATARTFGATDMQGFIILAVAMSVLHAAYEEGYWRWFIFGQLAQRMPIWLAHIIAGVAFAANHVVSGWVYAGPQVGLMCGLVVAVAGVMWSVLYRRHGSILGCWVAHVICDGSLFYVEWLMLTGRI